jgi:hypothetical protein
MDNLASSFTTGWHALEDNHLAFWVQDLPLPFPLSAVLQAQDSACPRSGTSLRVRPHPLQSPLKGKETIVMSKTKRLRKLTLADDCYDYCLN